MKKNKCINWNLLFTILILSLFPLSCSNEKNDNLSNNTSSTNEKSDDLSPKTSLTLLDRIDDTFWVDQGPVQCGAASFYMIFKFFGDHNQSNDFYELNNCSEVLDIKEDTTKVDKTSKIADWLNNTIVGIASHDVFVEKIAGIAVKNNGLCEQYYKVEEKFKTDDISERKTRLAYIQKNFCNNNRPVIIHLDRPRLGGIFPVGGHYIVLIWYDSSRGTVYFIDPNKKEEEPVVQEVPYTDFTEKDWYVAKSSNQANAFWDGSWIGFYH